MNTRPRNWKMTRGTGRRSGALRVCVVYEGVRDWRRAWLLLDHLHIAADVVFAVEWFSFEELPMFFERACREGAGAELVVLARSKRQPVPVDVHRWLMAVRDEVGLHPAALIGLFSEAEPGERVCPWERLLQDVAVAGGRDLFIRTTDAVPAVPAPDEVGQTVFKNLR